MVSRLEQATHSGGGGFCTRFCTPLRHGTSEKSPFLAGQGGPSPSLWRCLSPPSSTPTLLLRSVLPRPRQLVFVGNAELHGVSTLLFEHDLFGKPVSTPHQVRAGFFLITLTYF